MYVLLRYTYIARIIYRPEVHPNCVLQKNKLSRYVRVLELISAPNFSSYLTANTVPLHYKNEAG